MSEKEWTIMVYMAGDNNLAVDMAYAMEQIKEVAAEGAESPNLFVYYDGNSPSIPTLYCDFSEPGKPRYVRSYKVPNKLYAAPKKENENAAHPNSILNFVDWCVNTVEVENNGEISFGRRAQKYALIFSGHSLGFEDIGLFKDETSGKSMKMFDFYGVLQRLVSTKEQLGERAKQFDWEADVRKIETKELLGQKLDLLGFDSCVMGMLEVGYQFDNVAKTLIASEGSVPSAGWTYAKILGCLAREQNRNVDTRRVAENFVKEFVRSQDAYTVGGVSVDMAAWDLSRFDYLAGAFNGLSEVLLGCFADEKSRIYKQMERVILQVHWKCQSYMYDQNVDLGDFCELLDRECGLVIDELGGNDVEILKEVQRRCRNVLKEIQEAVILSGFSGGAYQYSNGVSVFFPWSRDAYEVSKKNYESLLFAKDVKRKQISWADFLKEYLYKVTLRKVEMPVDDTPVGSRFRYFSGVKFDERSASALSGGNGSSNAKIAGQEGSKIAGQEGSKIAGQEGSKIAGQEGSKIAGQEGSKIAGQEGSKIAGQEGSKIAGQEGSKIAGQEGSKIAGQEGSKIAGQEGSKIAGQEGSKIAGQEGSKIAGQEGSKIAGQEGSKIAGQEGSKIAGQEGSKIAGQEGSKMAGGGASGFFSSLRLFKNIESRWDISGFSKKPDEPHTADDGQVLDDTHADSRSAASG
jgi:Clostripain family